MTQEISRFRNSEIIDKFDPKVFQKYTIDKIVSSTNSVSLYQDTGRNNQTDDRMIICINKVKPPSWFREVVHVELSPKLKFFMTPTYNILLEDAPDSTLNQLINSLEPEMPFLSQQDTAKILKDVAANYLELKQKNILHGNLSTKAIVFEGGRWKIDIVPGLIDIDGSNKMYYPRGPEKNERAEVFALGVIMFKSLFGFFPFEQKFTESVKISTYLDCLNDKTIEGCAKIFFFLKAKLRLSQQAINVLELALSPQTCRLEDFAAHPFFKNLQRFETDRKAESHFMAANDEVKMLGSVDQKQLSKALAAIDRYTHKKIPLPNKQQLVNTLKSPEEVHQIFREDFHLSRFQISEHFIAYQEPHLVESRYDKVGNSANRNYLYGKQYFGEEISDLEQEYPCRRLLQYLDTDRKTNGDSTQRQERLLMYAYPHAIAFELLKDRPNQSSTIHSKIDTAADLLLEVSELNYPRDLQPQPIQSHNQRSHQLLFEDIKPKYRDSLHFLYKHYLNSAIYKYNSAKRELAENPNSQTAIKNKTEGLDHYRMCWKLLEASLINRKEGKDLQLGRIETGERKEIELGINGLLAKYFPNKLY